MPLKINVKSSQISLNVPYFMDGLRESIVSFSEGGVANTKDVMDLLVLNQYFDTLNEIGGTAGAKIIFQDSIKHPITEGVLQANASLGY